MMRRRPRKAFVALGIAAAVFFLGLAVPENAIIPVAGATPRDWNPESFWHEPWGVSGVHKGIDIFAPKGRAVFAPVAGLVVYRGSLGIGGNVVVLLGPKWRLHYFAHLRSSNVQPLSFVSRGGVVGEVGTSGNAAGKPPHLHYVVLSLLPRPWRCSDRAQGWKRMFFIDPNEVIGGAD